MASCQGRRDGTRPEALPPQRAGVLIHPPGVIRWSGPRGPPSTIGIACILPTARRLNGHTTSAISIGMASECRVHGRVGPPDHDRGGAALVARKVVTRGALPRSLASSASPSSSSRHTRSVGRRGRSCIDTPSCQLMRPLTGI
jgi:hypothetical protein